MAPILYYSAKSPPARAVVLAIRYLNINDIELQQLHNIHDDLKGPDMLKINPQHTIPFLDDNGFHLSESSAILYYLVDSRAPESSLLGRFPKTRALIQHRLHYFNGTLWPIIVQLFMPIIKGDAATVSPENKAKLFESLSIIDGWLEKKHWVAGDFTSIADFIYASIIATIVHCGFPIEKKFPHMWAYYKNLKTLPGIEENEEGARANGHLFKDKITESLDIE